MTPTPTRRSWRTLAAALAIIVGAGALAACGSSSTSSSSSADAPTASAGDTTEPVASGDVVLPVTSNPITNDATDQLFTIDEVLVENNVNPATGKDADDHLEIAVTNTGTTELTGFEVYYTIDDPTTGESESYYADLGNAFTIAPSASRVIHFDSTGAVDHFPDNPYSLYHTSLNALDVTVEVSAEGAAPQTATVQKDPGGDEVAD